MSAPTLPGVIVGYKFEWKPPVIHHHEWRQTQLYINGRVLKVHICDSHEEPLVQPYELLELSPAEKVLVGA